MDARVVHREDAEARREGAVTVRALISPEATGSNQLLQRELCFERGGSGPVGHPAADDVLFVVSGAGAIRWGPRGESTDLVPGRAFVVGPLVPARVHAVGGTALRIVSVLSPPPFDGLFPMPAREGPVAWLDEGEQPPLPAGEDRTFRLLLGPEHGARNVTQFVGRIERSKAPFHAHPYEEAIYVLEGEGVVHVVGAAERPIDPGTSIFLPPGTPHCLENRSEGSLRLLGVFSPPGSPADKREDEP